MPTALPCATWDIVRTIQIIYDWSTTFVIRAAKLDRLYCILYTVVSLITIVYSHIKLGDVVTCVWGYRPKKNACVNNIFFMVPKLQVAGCVVLIFLLWYEFMIPIPQQLQEYRPPIITNQWKHMGSFTILFGWSEGVALYSTHHGRFCIKSHPLPAHLGCEAPHDLQPLVSIDQMVVRHKGVAFSLNGCWWQIK